MKKKDLIEKRIHKIQQKISAQEIPVIILFSGGKKELRNSLINEFLLMLDPRKFRFVASFRKDKRDRLPLQKYWVNIPGKGEITVFDKGWYGDRNITNKEIRVFERQLTDNGIILIKIDVDLKEAGKFLEELAEILEKDLDSMLKEKKWEFIEEDLKDRVLPGVNLSKKLTKKEYKEALEKYQRKLGKLQEELENKGKKMVLVFEGWDAGGKGGAIKRLTRSLEPGNYVVNPVAAPNLMEQKYNYMWRFWNKLDTNRCFVVFDRSWYGRVMVERIEGFCDEQDWKRAYQEINEFEKYLWEHGYVCVKFWLHIDKDEQKNRFIRRKEDPDKQWKITEEDWRNRDKWEQYEDAVEEMIKKTSQKHTPWHIVEGNSKYYARIKVLKTVVETLKKL